MDAEPQISWRIVHRAPSFKLEWKRCPMCLVEKYETINFKDQDKLLNKKSEVMAQCRHRTKYSLDSKSDVTFMFLLYNVRFNGV